MEYARNKKAYLKLIGGNTDVRVILTVPHSVPLTRLKYKYTRTHDRAALKFAQLIKTKLESLNIKTTLIESSQNRKYLDDNRFEAVFHDTELWQKLFRVLNESQLENVILLDIHSFPWGSFKNEPIVLLSSFPIDDFNKALSSSIGAPILQAKSGSNSITDVMRILNILTKYNICNFNKDLSSEINLIQDKIGFNSITDAMKILNILTKYNICHTNEIRYTLIEVRENLKDEYENYAKRISDAIKEIIQKSR